MTRRHYVFLALEALAVAAMFLGSACNKSPNSGPGGGPANVLLSKAFTMPAPSGAAQFSCVLSGGGTCVADPQNPINQDCTASTAGTYVVTCTATFPNGGTETIGGTITVTAEGQLVANDVITARVSNGANNAVVSPTSSTGQPQGVMKSPTTFDLSQSVDGAGTTFTINYGDGNSDSLGAGVMSAVHTYQAPGRFTVSISGQDPTNNGNPTLQFSFLSTCDNTIPVVAFSGLSISPVDGGDLYNYTVSVANGSGAFSTLLDPDGTGAYRPGIPGRTGQFYADYVGNRTPHVIVNDLACGTQATGSTQFTFTQPVVTGMPAIGGINFIQGLLANNNADPRLNAMVTVLQEQSDKVQRVTQDYNPACLSGGGWNCYPATASGMTTNAQGTLWENAFTGNQLLNPAGNPNTSGNGDGFYISANVASDGTLSNCTITVFIAGNSIGGNIVQDQYGPASTSCSGNLQFLMIGNPCGTGNGNPTQVASGAQWAGIYGPVALSDSTGNTLNLTQGAFAGQSNVVPPGCSGGQGQGQGGVPPPGF